MSKLGKEAKFLLYSVLGIYILSLVFSMGLSEWMTRKFQSVMIQHDYEVAGYMLNHPEDTITAAITKEKSNADLETGEKYLEKASYTEWTDVKLLPTVKKYRRQSMLSWFFFLLGVFATIYTVLIFYIYKQRMTLTTASDSIRDFLDGNEAARIECEQSGDWYKLFHEVNELATILSAHAEAEKQTKEFLQDIISDVSHQIKTPLAALMMYYEIIEENRMDSEVVFDFTQKSVREIKRIEDVIYTLLKLARLDAGMITLNRADESLYALMQDVSERFETWADQESKTITLSGDTEIMLDCDALWLSEAVGNIIKNALEHTEVGAEIRVHWERTPMLTSIVVEDNGKGIHPEDIHHIFKRFYRSRFSQDRHGIGLGLPLAKSIVEAHGGTLSVTSRMGLGTVFTLNFFNITKM